MKNILTFSFFTFTFSLAAFAAPSYYWAAIETEAYSGDKSGGTATSGYSAYYCTVKAAEDLFGDSTLEAIESYVKNHFAEVKGMTDTTYDSVAYSDGEYQILHYVSQAFASSEYVAVAFYDSKAYRVYGYESDVGGSAALTPYGQLAFNETYAKPETVGAWTIPEPTSGLLLLLGVAGLALRRKSK